MTRVILDTDLNTDCGDAGAIALLHALADAGEAEILGIGVSVSNPDAPAAVAVINAWYGRGNLPLGAYDGQPPVEPEGWPFVRAILDATPGAPRGPWPGTTGLYRRLLAASPGGVQFVAIGFHNTLKLLLESGPDEHSPLNGADLVREKVRQLVVMGGNYPDSTPIKTLGGAEYNFYRAPEAAAFVCERWPTPVAFTGFEVGDSILAGRYLVSHTPRDNPVRVAYEAYEHPQGRSAWDETAVFYATRGPVWNGRRFFHEVRGTNRVNPQTGQNAFTPDPGGPHAYLVKALPDEEYSLVFDELQVRAPRHRSQP
ncbi:MAG TPA: nucleoside hydrolase [Deinococcales bacterium]|nr:nucleoside hydrolase [Deinococcales bacterium]